MGLFFYNIFLFLFNAGLHIAALFNTKAAKWVSGRRGILDKIKEQIGHSRDSVKNKKLIWMHCASLGEFEQGRPLLEKLRSQFPDQKLLLTFFSPSGYEIRKDYKGADWVFYLPMDGKKAARRFLQIVNPSLVIFVKYEYWYHYLKTIKQHRIPLLMVSALFREDAVFFKWYGGLQRKMLSFFTHLFVQNRESKTLLDSIGLAGKSSVAGDTRFDRVVEIAESFKTIPAIETFVGDRRAIVAGSTWPKDEQVLQQTMLALRDQSLLLIIAPHEINPEHISRLQVLFPDSILFSGLQNSSPEMPGVLIIDNIGMLSRLYNYAYITYVGGGFGTGIHNTLEAAVYGKPILFGPAYQKFNEAVELIRNGAAFSINNPEENITIIQKLENDEKEYLRSCESARTYVYSNRGASGKIIQYIQENRLLTS